MTKLVRRDKVELLVGTVVALAYFSLWASGQLPSNTPSLVHALVTLSLIAIYGDNALKVLAKGAPAVEEAITEGDEENKGD